MTDDMDKTSSLQVSIPGGMDGGEATQMMPQPGIEATQLVANVDCPVCHTPNPPSETYCIDCGFMLSSEPVEAGETPETPQVGSLVTSDGTREFALKPGESTVGRQDADVLLAHNTVSRKHATITVEDGKVYVEDAGSTNGTTVAGRKLDAGERVELADGAEVVFGSQALRLKSGEGEAPAEPESTDEHGSTQIESGEGEAPAEPVAPGEAEAEVEDSLPEPPTPISQPPAARLVCADGSLAFDLCDGTMTIGRREGNDIVIPDPYCSGSHAEIRIEDGAFTITDLGSTNGTLVNGVKLDPNSPREVQPGDEITLGRTVFKIEAPE